MLCRKPISCVLRLTQSIVVRQLSSPTTAPASASKDQWDLYAGVLVERLPVVSKTLNPLERQFQELLWRMEYEKSLKSNHELQHEHDIRHTELIKTGKVEVDLEEAATKQTAQDLRDAYVEELKKFKLADRTTPDDAKNNLRSTNRCLEDTLYLLVEHKLGNRTHFLLPQGQRQDGETMRQTAERVLRENCGDQLQVRFVGNAPCGFYKYKYPSSMRNQSVGAKVFFYRAILEQGNVDKAVSEKYEWLVKDNLDNKLQNSAYAESVHKFLI